MTSCIVWPVLLVKQVTNQHPQIRIPAPRPHYVSKHEWPVHNAEQLNLDKIGILFSLQSVLLFLIIFHLCAIFFILVREENMGLSSEIHTIERICASDKRPSVSTNLHPFPLTDQDPDLSDHRVRDKVTIGTVPSPTTGSQRELDFEALRDIVSHFRIARMQAGSHTGQSSPVGVNSHQNFLGQRDGHSSVPHSLSDDDVFKNQPVSFQATQGAAASQASSQVEAVSRKEKIHAEAVSTSECVVVSQSPNQVSSETQDGTAEPDSEVMETPSNTLNETESTRNRKSDTDIATDPSINTSGTKNDLIQDKEASEQGTTKNLIPPTSSSSVKSAEILVTSRNYGNRGGKRPVPGRSPYGMNSLVTVDRMLQSGSLWPAAQASRNSALGLRSQLLSSSVANTLTRSGIRGLLPSSNLTWNNFAQGTATTMWGIPPGVGLGQVNRTQFIQSYAWPGNPSFQGNGYPPPRGGYGGW